MSHSYLDDLFDRIDDDEKFDVDGYEIGIDMGREMWEGGMAIEDHPICPYGEGDENDLCTKDLYGCYIAGCEHADIEG